MSLLRAFVAVQIPPQIQEAIHASTSDLRQTLGPSLIRWTPLRNIHLTLKFLGAISQSNIEMLNQMLASEASKVEPFEIKIGALGVFPNPNRPRILWIGIQAPDTLEAVHHSIETAASRLGYEQEHNHFSPHLTIGRVKQDLTRSDRDKLRLTLEKTTIGEIGTAAIEAVYLMRSDLHPTGAVYTPISTNYFSNDSRGDP
ncbi:MAG: RNA 2',3'-cyclic phosphodiesterase [Anaerolineales bacterium]|nr:RNA 2',3'-cyclic phosphodiesterase [Anaerolineales bacterium]